MFACGVYFDTDLSVLQQLDMLEPLLRSWIGEDYRKHYMPEIDYFYFNPGAPRASLSIQRNVRYKKTDYDNDRFRYCLDYLDMADERGAEENLQRMTQVLQLLWSRGIPTCTPGKGDELPHGGGEEGPIPWP